MLSDDITNLCRAVFVKANGLPKDDPMQGYLMRIAGRLQCYRDQIQQLERARVPDSARASLVIDLSDDRIVPFPKMKRPIPDEGGAA
ncbi:hypothetical protein J7481_06690 [Labrenzia sp. R4_2]|uniref:hypothetical protein n=1 Tax=Labrenzia sp. R4_2 TaxID=2821107 RepID=UPI001ADA8CE1|nr:hypothetical protein [Labrenzia sp. R4_2]MBO9419176.1 hypothetical protein [Labrenzia sp. R4_2]